MRKRDWLRRPVHVLLVIALAAALVPGVASAGPPSPDGTEPAAKTKPGADIVEVKPPTFVEGEVIVTFKTGVSVAKATSAHAAVGATRVRALGAVEGAELVRLKAGMTVEEAMKAYSARPEVAAVQPNYRIRQLAPSSGDPMFSELWGLYNTGQTGGTIDADIDAEIAWEGYTRGSDDVMVGVVDTGVDYMHPDLVNNMWVNPGEVPGDGVDNDGNGWIDDVHGYDFINDDGDPMDDNGHGTHCAGTIGAQGGNSLGVVGVNWDVRIVALKIFDADGVTTTAAILDAFDYAAAMDILVLSNSWGGGDYDGLEVAAISSMTDTLFLFAAGNDDTDTDATPYYPAGYALDNIVSVGASDHNDERASFSNYGATSVDVFAPGAGIKSTIPGAQILVPLDGVGVTTLAEYDFTYASDLELDAEWDRAHWNQPWQKTSAHYRTAGQGIALTGYMNDEKASITTVQPLDLYGTTAPWLEFYVGYDTEPDYDFFSWGVVDHEAGTEQELGRVSGTSAGPWEQHMVDLSAYKQSGDVHLYFLFESDGSVSPADGDPYEGVWLDDVRVIDLDTPRAEVFRDGFDSAATGWTVVTTDIGSSWSWEAASGWTEQGAWRVMPYAASTNTWLRRTTPVDLSEGEEYTLSFWLWGLIENNFDKLYVYASPDGTWTGSEQLLTTFTGDSGGWQQISASLDAFAGDDSVYLAFRFDSDTSVEQTGLAIDDVVVSGVPFEAGVDYVGAYDSWDGTSMATPHVAGIAGLLLARNANATPAELKAAILDSVDVIADTADATDIYSGSVTHGRVNAGDAVATINGAPVATDDYFVVPTNATGFVLPVCANDTDPDGDPIQIYQYSAPGHGVEQPSMPGDTSFVYTPNAGYQGIDQIMYCAIDDRGAVSEWATVTLDVKNTAPILATIGPKSVSEGVKLSFTAKATDASGDPLTFSLVSPPAGAAITSAGVFSWTPTEAQGPGTHTVTVKVSDGKGGTDTEAVKVTVAEVNKAPVLTLIGPKSVNEGVKLSFTAKATDADLPANTLTFSLVSPPAGAAITSAGVFSWTPTEIQGPGTYTVTVKVSDGKGGTDTEAVKVTVAEVATRYVPVEGATRIETAIEASKLGFPKGSKYVLVATSAWFTDALAGSALAGTLDAPVLLTDPKTLPASVRAEIVRLKATNVIVLGEAAPVAAAIDAIPGVVVETIRGTSRYDTATKVAVRAITEKKKTATYGGVAFVATGENFPDALGASPIAAARCWPIFLASPAAGANTSLVATMKAQGVKKVVCLGGDTVVSKATYTELVRVFGAANVARKAGFDRYETAMLVAQYGITTAGLTWTKPAIATGETFPDALVAGPLQARAGSVLLLTRTATLYPGAASALTTNKRLVSEVRFLGGTGALSTTVRTQVKAALK